MKNIVLVITTAMLGVITLLIVLTIYGRMNRSMELKSSLPSVMEETVESMIQNQDEMMESDEEVLKRFTNELLLCLETQSDVMIDILQFDREKGILSVRVTETFGHPNGEKGTVSCERTVIADALSENEEVFQCRVRFWINGECYKTYEIRNNDEIQEPYVPENVTDKLKGWMNTEGNLLCFPQKITQDTDYYAVLQE